MRTTVFLEDSFDSAHYLPNVPHDHKCRRLHGHTYRVRIEISGALDPTLGWVVDYADVKSVWEPIKREIDHKTVNDIHGLENSTCENIARWVMAEIAPETSGVKPRRNPRDRTLRGVRIVIDYGADIF